MAPGRGGEVLLVGRNPEVGNRAAALAHALDPNYWLVVLVRNATKRSRAAFQSLFRAMMLNLSKGRPQAARSEEGRRAPVVRDPVKIGSVGSNLLVPE